MFRDGNADVFRKPFTCVETRRISIPSYTISLLLYVISILIYLAVFVLLVIVLK